MGEPVKFKPCVVSYTVNGPAIEMVEGLLERLKSGQAVAVAIVEVERDGVATYWSRSFKQFHYICSGAATLLSQLAAADPD